MIDAIKTKIPEQIARGFFVVVSDKIITCVADFISQRFHPTRSDLIEKDKSS